MNNAVVYDDGIRVLRQGRDKNVFVALKTIDLHQPGSFEGIPRKYLPQALQDRGETIFNALHWMDHCVRIFFEKLEQEQLFDEHTLVIVTSDHAPHPGVGYKSIVPPHEYHRLGRLPLIFITRDPGALPEMATNGFASQVDVSPTILSLLGVAKPRGWVGRSLVGRDQPRIGLGVYRDRFYYGSDRGSFVEELGEGAEESPRNRAIRKWLSNLDVDSVGA
jgi:arylsulfatase A-like enzyme